jgi:hypothetical protein
MSENSDGSNDGLFSTETLTREARSGARFTSSEQGRGQNRPETPRPDGKFTPDALSDIRGRVDAVLATKWWPAWPVWASTESGTDWDRQEAQAREVPCTRCGARFNEACIEPHPACPALGYRFRVAHVARHKAAELAAQSIEDESDAYIFVELTDEGRAYLASLRDRNDCAERMQRIGEGLSPLVVDGEVRS